MPAYLPSTLEDLVRLGANITIDDVMYTPDTLIRLAAIAQKTGSHITIRGRYLPNVLTELARIAGGNITVVVALEK